MNDNCYKRISNICNFTGIIWMIYKICYDVLAYNKTFPQVFLQDPIGYATGFAPFIAGGMSRIRDIVEEGFHGPATRRFVCEPLTYLFFLFIDLLIIKYFEMYIEFSFAFNRKFIIGFVLIIIFAMIQAAVFAYLEHESVHEVFVGRTLWLAWLTLATFNGCMDAYKYVEKSGEPIQEAILKWVGSSIGLTLSYMICIIIYSISLIFFTFGKLLA